jgi:hypothetical protein
MWDRKSAATEAAEAITTAEVDLRSFVEGLGILEEELCWLSDFMTCLVCNNFFFSSHFRLLMHLWPCCL